MSAPETEPAVAPTAAEQRIKENEPDQRTPESAADRSSSRQINRLIQFYFSVFVSNCGAKWSINDGLYSKTVIHLESLDGNAGRLTEKTISNAAIVTPSRRDPNASVVIDFGPHSNQLAQAKSASLVSEARTSSRGRSVRG